MFCCDRYLVYHSTGRFFFPTARSCVFFSIICRGRTECFVFTCLSISGLGSGTGGVGVCAGGVGVCDGGIGVCDGGIGVCAGGVGVCADGIGVCDGGISLCDGVSAGVSAVLCCVGVCAVWCLCCVGCVGVCAVLVLVFVLC